MSKNRVDTSDPEIIRKALHNLIDSLIDRGEVFQVYIEDTSVRSPWNQFMDGYYKPVELTICWIEKIEKFPDKPTLGRSQRGDLWQ